MFAISRPAALAIGLAIGLAAATAPPSRAQTADPVGPVLLTVTGDIAAPNRGAVDAATDPFFTFNEIEFDKAVQLDYAALQALDLVKVRADFPKGGPIREFEGVPLADILDAIGAKGETVTIRALDGYAVEAPLAEMIAQGAVVALKRDGRPFGLGDFGPTQIVFPRAGNPALADMPDDRWVWSIYHINVE